MINNGQVFAEMEGATNKIVFAMLCVLCIAWRVHTQVNCTASGAGRFPNTNDSACQNYTLCVYVSANTSYVSYDYVCPTTSVFNPTTALCTSPANYTCTTATG